MSNKDKDKKPPKVLVRTKAGPQWVVDHSIKPEEKPWATLKELQKHIAISLEELRQKYEHLGLREVDLYGFLQAVLQESPHEEGLMRLFDRAVLESLDALHEVVADLRREAQEEADRQFRDIVRSSTASDPNNFTRMLEAFERQVETLDAIDQQIVSNLGLTRESLEEIDHLFDRGVRIYQDIAKTDTCLQELVRGTARQLADFDNLPARAELEIIWVELDRLLIIWRKAKLDLRSVDEQYQAVTQKFFQGHDATHRCVGDWRRQLSLVQSSKNLFEAAGLDPFEFSDRLSRLDQNKIFAVSCGDRLAAVDSLIPQEFPKFSEGSTEERTCKVIDDLEKVIELPVAPPKPETCPMDVVELVVCVWAVCTKRTPKGNPYPKSGRTIHKVYEDILAPIGLCFGYSEGQIRDAVLQASGKGLMQHFTIKGSWIIYQVTVEGFKLADTLMPKLPADFASRIQGQYAKLCVAQAEFKGRFKKTS